MPKSSRRKRRQIREKHRNLHSTLCINKPKVLINQNTVRRSRKHYGGSAGLDDKVTFWPRFVRDNRGHPVDIRRKIILWMIGMGNS